MIRYLEVVVHYQMVIRKLFFVFLCIGTAARAHVVVWDIHGVLVKHNQKKVLSGYSFGEKLRGFFSAAGCAISHPHMREFYFQTLSDLPYKSTTSYEVYSDDGKTPMPALLKDFMLGNISYEGAKKVWYSVEHKDFLNKVFEFNFDPQRFAKALELRKQTVKLLQECASQVDEQSNKKNVCILLSNCGPEFVQPFKERFKEEIADYVDFEHSVFSGCVHCAKPDKTIFDVLAKKIEQLPDNIKGKIFFFDDQQVNCDAGQACNPNMICAHPYDAPDILKNH